MATGWEGFRTLIYSWTFQYINIIMYVLLWWIFSLKKNIFSEHPPSHDPRWTGQRDIGSMGRFAFNRERNLTFGGRRVDRVRSPNPAFYREQRWPGDNFLCEWGKKWNLLNAKKIDRSIKFLKGCCNNEEFSFKCEWIMKEIQNNFWPIFWELL